MQPQKEELEKHGIFADFVPSRYSSRELAAEWILTLRADEKVLLARAEEASEELSDALKEAGIDYEDVALYHTAVDQRKSEELNRIPPQVDYVTLCSASAVRAYVSMLDEVGKAVRSKNHLYRTGHRAGSKGSWTYSTSVCSCPIQQKASKMCFSMIKEW